MIEDQASGEVRRPRTKRNRDWTRVARTMAFAMAFAAALIAIAGCGSSSGTSSLPAYCSQRTSLQNSVNGLKNLNPSSGVSGLKSQVEKIQTEANKVVSSAKSDFPSETSAIKSSVDAFKGSVEALPSSPTAAQIGAVTQKATDVLTSVEHFQSASKSKCS